MIRCDKQFQAVHLSGCILSGSIENRDTATSICIKPIQPQHILQRPQRGNRTKHEAGRVNERIIKGVRGLAEFLGCGVNKAQQIVNSGVLISEKITYKMGNTWITNREKLTVLLEENPRIFEKLSTKS